MPCRINASGSSCTASDSGAVFHRVAIAICRTRCHFLVHFFFSCAVWKACECRQYVCLSQSLSPYLPLSLCVCAGQQNVNKSYFYHSAINTEFLAPAMLNLWPLFMSEKRKPQTCCHSFCRSTLPPLHVVAVAVVVGSFRGLHCASILDTQTYYCNFPVAPPTRYVHKNKRNMKNCITP